MDILDTVKTTIQRHHMFEDGETVVVAVSGGPDSMALLHVLWRLKGELNLHLHMAHLNHSIRKEESDKDSQFVSQLAETYDCPVTIEKSDLPAFIREYGGSLEEKAREVRYTFLHRIARSIGATKIATGHNADDRAETTLMWLLRGTGPTGLRGIPPLREGVIVRPLIDITREEIESYLEEHGLPSRFDSSNLDRRHLRNKIRHELLPTIQKEYSPNIIQRIGRLADLMAEEEHFFEQEVKRLLPRIVQRGSGRKIVLDIQALSVYSLALQRRILRYGIRFLKGNLSDILFKHVQLLLEAIDSPNSGLIIDLPGDLVAERTEDALIIRMGKTVNFDRELVVPGKTELPEIDGALRTERVQKHHLRADIRKTGAETGYFDSGLMRGQLRIRTKRQGDAFRPLGMRGSKKLQDFFVDEKISRLERQEIPLLTVDEEIAWVVGRRISDTFKVTDDTQDILQVNFMHQA